MVKLILADGTELKGFKQNGNNYVSQTEVDVSVFEDNLSTLRLWTVTLRWSCTTLN